VGLASVSLMRISMPVLAFGWAQASHLLRAAQLGCSALFNSHVVLCDGIRRVEYLEVQTVQ
jgi:hypothetical protein